MQVFGAITLFVGFVVDPVFAQEEARSVGFEVQQTLAQQGDVRVVVALDQPSALRSKRRVDLQVLNQQVQRAQAQVLSTVSEAGIRVLRRFESVPAFVGRVRSRATLRQLAQHPAVRRIDRDAGGGGGLDTSVEIVGADRWQEDGVTGEGVRVAVLDSGLDTDHVDLGDDLVHEACFLNVDGQGQCPDGTDRQTGAGAAADDHGHGTSVSGIVTSAGTRAPRGVAPDAEIVAVKVLNSSNRFSSFSEIVEALDYLVNNPDLGVTVVNMSLGTDAQFAGGCDNTTAWNMSGASAVRALRSQGILTVASSMNQGSGTTMGSPACLSNVVSVGATDGGASVTDFSNSNGALDLVAPGVNIRTTGRGDGTASFGGTSAAAPHAAGCAALLRAADTDTSPDEIEASLKTSPVQARDDKNGLEFPRLACYTARQLVALQNIRATTSADGSPNAGRIPFSLRWRTVRERDSEGFIVQRRLGGEPDEGVEPIEEWTRIGFVETKAPEGQSSDTLQYRFEGTLPAPGRYSFRLRHATEQQSEEGRTLPTREVLEAPIPGGTVAVEGPYPNPSRGEARLEVVVEETQNVRIALYDAMGRRVQVLYDGRLAAKRPLLLDTEQQLASGTYVLRTRGDAFTDTRMMTVVR
jgi:hypothetical protein